MDQLTQSDFDMLERYVVNAWKVSVVAGAAGDEPLKRKAWRQFCKLEKYVRAAGWQIDTSGAVAHVVDPSGRFVATKEEN